jgi:hypothetical protein
MIKIVNECIVNKKTIVIPYLLKNVKFYHCCLGDMEVQKLFLPGIIITFL